MRAQSHDAFESTQQSSCAYDYDNNVDNDYDNDSDTDPDPAAGDEGCMDQCRRAFRPDMGGVSRLKPLLQRSRGTAYVRCCVLSTPIT
ncbi:hypothetical protein JXA88_04815 [Candidatus Fermentibacteria bacterium]|nr:hypothetical protein [Candidatus Fermentibacteria bacterium]